MQIGTGVFLSAVLLSLTVLIVVTQDKWDWWGFFKRTSLWAAVVLVITGSAFVAINYANRRPKKETALCGIHLGDSVKDVIFRFGKPDKYSTDTDWHYSESERQFDGTVHDTHDVGIRFHNGLVQFISLSVGPEHLGTGVNSIALRDPGEMVVKVYGPDYTILSTRDGYTRIYSYPKFDIFFVLDLNQVFEMGVYDPSQGPITFVDEGGEGKTPFPGGRMMPMILAVKKT